MKNRGRNTQIFTFFRENCCRWSYELPMSLYGMIGTIEEIAQMNKFLYKLYNLEEAKIGYLARIRLYRHSSILRVLLYKSLICFVSNINTLFKIYRCPSFDHFIKRAPHREILLNFCQKEMKKFTQRACINNRKHCWIKFVFFCDLLQTIRSLSGTWHYLT